MPTRRIAPFDPPPELLSTLPDQPLTRLVFPDGEIGWLVTSHSLAQAVLAERSLSVRDARSPMGDPLAHEAMRQGEGASRSGNLLANDPPQHTRLRRLLAGRFTPRTVQQLRSHIEAIVDDRIGIMADATPPIDFVEGFALPVPSLTLCALLGVAPEDRRRFEEPTEVQLDPTSSPEAVAAATQRFLDYATGVVAEKRRSRSEDLLSDLATNPDLTDDEVAGMAIQLFRAGHETTANMFALGVYALLDDRSRWEALCNDPGLAEPVVEELLRYLTILQATGISRTATEDIELDGVPIRAGERIAVSLATANRDFERFESGDEFDFQRDTRGHLAFGYGIHMCLGQHLARLELHLGLAALSQRLPSLTLDESPTGVVMHDGARIPYGVQRLSVTW